MQSSAGTPHICAAAAMSNWRMGFDLLKTGRLSLVTEKIKQHGDISRMLDATDAKKGS